MKKYLFNFIFIVAACGNSNSHIDKNVLTDTMISKKGDNHSDSLRLGDVLKLGRDFVSKDILITKVKKGNKFNFDKFIIEDDQVDKQNYYQIGYDLNNNIISVEHFSNNDNYQMKVFYIPNTNSKIIFVDYFWDDKSHSLNDFSMVKGIILLTESGKFFLGKSEYDGQFFKETKGLSSIMSLDRKLNVVDELRLLNNKILFKGKVNYDKNNLLKSECIFVPINEIKISELTTISDIEKLMKLSEAFYKTGNVEFRITLESYNKPLWIWDGNHQFIY